MAKLKVHLGCGTVYLKDWVNVDLNIEHHYLAKDRPDLVQENETTLSNYYKEPVTKDDFKKGTYHKKLVVCDIFANVMNLPFEPMTVDAMLAVQLLEHFSRKEADYLLDYWKSLLREGGSLRIHVPDIEGIYEEYKSYGDVEWMIRQIYGSQKHEYSYHKYGYTRESLTYALLWHGFKLVKEVNNINDYPAFGLIAYI